MKCLFCNESYSDGLFDEHFFKVNVFGIDKIICECCKKRLKRVKK